MLVQLQGRPVDRRPYPSDVSDEEWAFVAPYLTLCRADAQQRVHDLREVFNGLRWLARAGSGWRMLPHDLPPWYTVYQQTRRWLAAGVFADLVGDLRMLLREIEGRAPQPTAAVLDSRTLQSSPESGGRATMAPSAARAPRSTSPSIRWGICSPCW